jgi:outer membrane protein OmpA-like peptidoglycan-associated protein
VEEPLPLRRLVSVLLLSAIVLCAPSWLSAQSLRGLPPGADTSKHGEIDAEVFSGYSGYRAGGTVDGVKVPDFKFGWNTEFILHTKSWAGLVADLSGHNNASASAFDFAFGPRLQLPLWHFTPFIEAMTGVQHFSPKGFPSQNAQTYIVGAGMDVKINSAFSIRPFQLSFINTYYSVIPTAGNKQNYLNGYLVQAGVIYNLRRLSSARGEVIASCHAQPSAVDPGGQVKIGVTTKGFAHRNSLRYSYAATGGTIAGSTAKETVDTTGVGPGAYTVAATVVDVASKSEQTAGCEAKFIVNAKQTPPPPVVAEKPKQTPAPTVAPNQPKTPPTPPVAAEQPRQTPPATVVAEKPNQTPTPTVASEQPKQTPPALVASDRSLAKHDESSASADTAQTEAKINAPKPSRYGIIKFERDVKRPTRVDNEAKGELDRYADALAAAPDVTAVVVGYAGAKDGKDRKSILGIASQRAANTKDYVVKGKGIDPARIQPRIDIGGGQKAELWILPAAATFAENGTMVVDENKVKAVPRIPLKARNAHKRLRNDARKRGVRAPSSSAALHGTHRGNRRKQLAALK